jgi:hypothetical protein
MDSLMSRCYTRKHSDIVVPGAVVDLATGHMPAADRAADALRALHPGLRISGIRRERGLMWIDVDMEVAVYQDDIHERIDEIVSDARTLSAWSCSVDGRPGWLVDTPQGLMVLCPACQRSKGIEVKRHEA